MFLSIFGNDDDYDDDDDDDGWYKVTDNDF